MIGSGEKSVAEADGEIGHQGRLVGFDGEQILALSVPNGLADRPLANLGIAVVTVPRSGKPLSSARAAVISVPSGSTRNWPITAPNRLAKAATRCTPRCRRDRPAQNRAGACRRVPRARARPSPVPFSQHRLGHLQVQSLEEVMLHRRTRIAARSCFVRQPPEMGRSPWMGEWQQD